MNLFTKMDFCQKVIDFCEKISHYVSGQAAHSNQLTQLALQLTQHGQFLLLFQF